MLNKTIKELHEDLISGEVTSDELVKESIKISHEVENKYIAEIYDSIINTEKQQHR